MELLYTRAAIIGRDAPCSLLFCSGFVTAGRMADICDVATCIAVCIEYTQANKSRDSDQEACHVAYSKALRMHPLLPIL